MVKALGAVQLGKQYATLTGGKRRKHDVLREAMPLRPMQHGATTTICKNGKIHDPTDSDTLRCDSAPCTKKSDYRLERAMRRVWVQSTSNADKPPLPPRVAVRNAVKRTQGVHGMVHYAGDCSDSAQWLALIEALNAVRTEGAGMSWRCFAGGEYNRVFFPDRCWSEEAHREFPDRDTPLLPTILDPSTGAVVAPNDVVVRVTRPDRSVCSDGEGVFHRFKDERDVQREVRVVLHGDENGFAPRCYYAIGFRADVVRGCDVVAADRTNQKKPLYGLILVLHRGDQTVSSWMMKANPALPYTTSLVNSAIWTVIAQARTGVLNFDIKPDNLVWMNGRAKSIDFDPAMYFVEAPSTWRSNLVVNLLLLGCHVRNFHPSGIADAWARQVRGLLLALYDAIDCDDWVYTATLKPRAFRGGCCSKMGGTEARARFEMMAHSYFTRSIYCSGRTNCFDEERNLGLVEVLSRYVLHGDATRYDADIDRAVNRKRVDVR